MPNINWVALSILLALFGLISWLGFAAANSRKGELDELHEWGLGGRRFGTLVSWFLIGGDLYTAYTLIAVPALAFGAGAVVFFAVPYTIVTYPVVFLVFPRIWQLSKEHGYITAAPTWSAVARAIVSLRSPSLSAAFWPDANRRAIKFESSNSPIRIAVSKPIFDHVHELNIH